MLSRISDLPSRSARPRGGLLPPAPAIAAAEDDPAAQDDPAAGGTAPGGPPPLRRALTVGIPAAVATFAAGTILSLARINPLALGVGCLCLGAVLVIAALIRSQPGLRASYAASCGAVAAAWLAFAGTARPLALPPALVLIVAAAALIRWYPAIIERERRAAEEAARAAQAARTKREQRKWPDLLARIGHPGIRFVSREPTLAGYLVHLQLPGSGKVTFSGLVPATEKLEVAAQLRHGSLRFERGDQAHKVILHVSERDVLAETIPLPYDDRPLSIVNPIPLGVFEDGQVCAVTLRELATLIVGLRGSGKSNLLNVLLAQLARCADVLIFAIDLKGGRMAAPWIEPWLNHRSRRPVVDWLATDRDEAEKMLRALIRAVQDRSRSGSGGEKITPSARQPAVLLLCDEIAVILGVGTGGPRSSLNGGVTNATLAGLATQLVMTGRSEAIDLIMATQRAAVTMIGSADLKSQCALRIGLGVSSEADARLIIPDDVQIAGDLARLRHPGTGIVQQGKQGRVMPVKFYRIEHNQISEIAERCDAFRPGPDPLLERALGEDYATRWAPDRAARIPGVTSGRAPAAIAAPVPDELPWADELAEPDGLRPAVEAGPAKDRAAEDSAADAWDPAEENGFLEDPVLYYRVPDEPAAPEPAAAHLAPPRSDPPRPDPDYAALYSAGRPPGDPAAAEGRRRIAAMLRSAGVRGMTVRTIGEQLAAGGVDADPQVITGWLSAERDAGNAEDASYGRWKWRGGR
jgi:hypothetical protein